jgi:NAD(P)-dependent dehydrogenase (short-subunit alcohol dehydrogenase family)
MPTQKKVVLITGAGRGLGRATAETFQKVGFDVIATDINLESLADNSTSPGYTCFQLDVTSENEMARCARLVEEKFGRINVLVSNAGVVDFYPVSEAGADKLKKIFDVNLLGLANITKYFTPLLAKSSGRLIVIGSESYKVPAPFQPYAVSKKALEALYESIKIELSLKDVKCVLIRPGAMQTEIIDKTINMQDIEDDSVYSKEFQNFKKSVPGYINKISRPAEVAKLVLKAGTIKNPIDIYSINHHFLTTMLSCLPKKWQQQLIKNLLSSD